MINNLVNQYGLDRAYVISSLPFVLEEVRNYTNQYFLTKTHSRVDRIEDNQVFINQPHDFQVGDSIELLNSENNTLIYQIKTINETSIELEQDLTPELKNPRIVMIKLSFRGVNLKTVVDMITYSQSVDGVGIKQQSLGGYSVTFALPSGGETIYPLELYGGLKSLRKLHDDYAEYWRKGYARVY